MSRATIASTCVYPWDVIGDPAAADRIASIGVREVAVAGAYHAVRAVTPRHPSRRVVTVPGSRVYFPLPGPAHGVRPFDATDQFSEDSFGRAVESLTAAGLFARAWVVLTHDDSLGALHPELTLCNAYGESYPWALCPSRSEVVDHAVRLATAVAERPGVTGIELEACGWYGFAHGGSHEKTGTVGLAAGDELLLSICTCHSCAREYGDAGVDVDELRLRIRRALDGGRVGTGRLDAMESALGRDLANVVTATRQAIATRLRRAVVSGIRSVAAPKLRVLLHSDPDPLATGGNPGVDVTEALADVDALLFSTPAVADAAEDQVREAVETTRGRLVMRITTVTGMDADAGLAVQRARMLRAAGVGELLLYHAGLATNEDLARMHEATAVFTGRNNEGERHR